MEVCSWDWGAIASFIGAGATIYAAHIALHISNQWSLQKKREKLSSFCDLTNSNLSKLNIKINDLHENFSVFPVKNITQNIEDRLLLGMFNNIKKSFNDLKIELEVIGEKTRSQTIKNKIDLIENLIQEHSDIYICIISKDKTNIDHRNELDDKISDFDVNFENFKIDVSKVLINYIFYET
jgi:hypothetical protein